MLQDFWKHGQPGGAPEGKLGLGVTICFQCADALAFYREVRSKGIQASTPFVGNGLWTTTLTDPDGYRLEFGSPTDVPEETVLSDNR
jgi:lactoylglutathione lyase